jgi:hypothetical protein
VDWVIAAAFEREANAVPTGAAGAESKGFIYSSNHLTSSNTLCAQIARYGNIVNDHKRIEQIR